MLATTAATEASRHKCLIYEGHPSQQLPVIVPLLRDGLERNYRCLYLGSPEMIAMVDGSLAQGGVDTRRETARGALKMSDDRSHLAGGRFDPRSMVDGLCSAIDEAVSDGFAGLCATGDMRWELGDDANFDHLLEYEALLEQVFKDRPLRGICQYHRDTVPARAVRDALLAHRSTYVGEALNRDNLFYIPPEILLDAASAEGSTRHSDWMCQQIIRVLDAESARDEVLRNLERRVAERTAELEQANQRLEAFSIAVSHDLRSPLRAIRGFTDMLAADYGTLLPPEGSGYVERVRASAARMDELIEGMFDLSRAERSVLNRERVNLSALADEVAVEVRETEPARSADFVIQGGAVASADRVLLRAVLANLLGNAWKFTSKRDRARIEFGVRATAEGEAAFFVRDNGAGFDSTKSERLFGDFQRLHSQSEFAGTGIGLSTVRRIVTKHGGRVWAESRPGEGATFWFTLPDTVEGSG